MNRRKLKENRHKQQPAYVLGFWALVALLFLSTVPAHAEWVAVEKDYLLPGLQTVYVGSRQHSQRREFGDHVAIN